MITNRHAMSICAVNPPCQVLSAALALVCDTVRHYGRVMEPQLDRLLPLLLGKGAEQKEGLRVACADVLSGGWMEVLTSSKHGKRTRMGAGVV